MPIPPFPRMSYNWYPGITGSPSTLECRSAGLCNEGGKRKSNSELTVRQRFQRCFRMGNSSGESPQTCSGDRPSESDFSSNDSIFDSLEITTSLSQIRSVPVFSLSASHGTLPLFIHQNHAHPKDSASDQDRRRCEPNLGFVFGS